MTAPNVTGHVYLVERKHGAKWYAKYRLPDGRQVQKMLGPAWTDKGRPPAGYLTERTAKEALAAILTDARRGALASAGKTGATFADASAEYLRYVAQVKKIDTATVRDYRGVVKRLDAEFGDAPLEAVTPDMIDAYKEGLIAHGKLSNRVIVRHLTVLHGIFKRAKRVRGIARNPASADLVERPRVDYSASSTPSTAGRSSYSSPSLTTRRTRRSTGWPLSPACGRASCWRCAGGTPTSWAASCTSARTTPTAARRSTRRAGRSAACR